MEANQMLLNAIDQEKPDKDKIKEALKNGADVNKILFTRGDSSETPLTIAAYRGAGADIFTLLLDAGADVNHKIHGEYTALIRAAFYCPDVESIKVLVARGADLNAKDTEEENSVYGDDPLLSAAASKNEGTEIMEYLYRSGISINTRDMYGNTPLMVAINNKNIKKAVWLLEHGADPDTENNSGKNVLCCAAQSWDISMFELIYRHVRNKDINHADHYGATIFLNTLCSGHYTKRPGIEIERLLVKMGADVNAWDYYGTTPLFHAVDESRNQEIIEFLLENGADINPSMSNPKMIKGKPCLPKVPLSGAIESKNQNRNRDLAGFLINRGADINLADRFGWTPLITAVCAGDIFNVKRLVSLGADVSKKTNNGDSAAIKAVGDYFTGTRDVSLETAIEITKILLDAGGNVNESNNNGDTLLITCASCDSDKSKMLQMLLDRGADIKMRNFGGQNALMSSIRPSGLSQESADENEKNFEFLMSKGKFDVNEADDNGETPLFYAVSSNRKNVVRSLLVSGADPNVRNWKGTTPLISSVLPPGKESRNDGGCEVFRILLDSGADPYMEDINGQDAFFKAISAGRPDLFAILLEKCGADEELLSRMGTFYNDNPRAWDMCRENDAIIASAVFMSGAANCRVLDCFLSQLWVENILGFIFPYKIIDPSSFECFNPCNVMHPVIPTTGKCASFLSFFLDRLDEIPVGNYIYTSLEADRFFAILSDALDTDMGAVIKFLDKSITAGKPTENDISAQEKTKIDVGELARKTLSSGEIFLSRFAAKLRKNRDNTTIERGNDMPNPGIWMPDDIF